MFTVFHTADWHLGQSFFGFDRDYEHARFLDWLLAELQRQQPQALLIAGDVFDSINPSAVAQKRYYNFLATAHAMLPDLQIVITAGNHDAGARLEAPSALLHALQIRVVGTVSYLENGEIDVQKFLVPLTDSNGVIRAIVLAIPFLRPADVPLLQDAADPYLDGIRELYRQVTAAALELKAQQAPQAALIAMGHCHLQGGDESRDSERRLVVGGAEAISLDIFSEEIAYVALGHLHKPQRFSDGRIRYSGSTIPLSFAEAAYRHAVLRLTLEHGQLVAVDELPIPRTAALLTVPQQGAATIDDVLPLLQSWTPETSQPPEQHPFLEVRVLETGPDPTRRRRIEEALQGKPLRLASIKVHHAVDSAELALQDAAEPAVADLQSISPEDVFQNLHVEKYGVPADPGLLQAFREILLQEQSAS